MCTHLCYGSCHSACAEHITFALEMCIVCVAYIEVFCYGFKHTM